MTISSTRTYRHSVESGVLPIMALKNYFNLEEIMKARKISAAIINISGRQRMLSQKTAFFSMRLVYSPEIVERTQLRACLLYTSPSPRDV
jgi:two-component system NtrC family sensor kinase